MAFSKEVNRKNAYLERKFKRKHGVKREQISNKRKNQINIQIHIQFPGE